MVGDDACQFAFLEGPSGNGPSRAEKRFTLAHSLLRGFDFLHRETCRFPVFESTGIGNLVTFGGEGGADDSSAFSGAAIKDDFFVSGFSQEFLPLFLVTIEITFWQEHGRGGDAAFGALGWFANVHENGFAVGNELGGGFGRNFFNRGAKAGDRHER